MSAVLWPALTKAEASGVPAWPEPMTMLSYFEGEEDILTVERNLRKVVEGLN